MQDAGSVFGCGGVHRRESLSCEGCMLEVRWVVAVWFSHVQILMWQWQGLRAPVVSRGDIWCTKMYVQGVDN